MAIWQWAKVASSNANADPTISLFEGQAASTLNDAMRNMLAQLAAWRDDTNGSLLTGGSGSAYTLLTNQRGLGQPIPATPPAGTRVSARAHAANTVSSATTPTLKVDDSAAFPIVTATGASPAVGGMLLGAVYDFTFDTTTSKWIVSGVAAASVTPPASVVVPIGGTIIWWSNTLPAGGNWLWCNGQAFSSITYPSLAAIVGTNTPDLREVVPIGRGQMGSTSTRSLVDFTGYNVLETLFGSQVPSSPAHRHTVGYLEPNSNQGHQHPATTSPSASFGIFGVGGSGPPQTGSGATSSSNTAFATTGITIYDGVDPLHINETGAFSSGNTLRGNIQPSVVCNWIIRAS